jgi:hypothetical protein
MSAYLLQILALSGAFWTAVFLYYRREQAGNPGRFVFGLGLGALLAHLGWALLHLPLVREHPWAVLDPAKGFCVLFVPLGPLLLTPWAAALSTLPLALAVARLGCLVAGCCGGAHGEPTPLYEIAGLVALHAVVWRLPDRWVVPTVLAGLGLVRLGVEPWRAAPPLGEPMVSAATIAALWLALGLFLAARVAVRTSRIVRAKG